MKTLRAGAFFALVASFVLTHPTFGQNQKQSAGRGRPHVEGQPAADVLPHWQSFQSRVAARNGGPLSVSWNQRSGAPASIFGKLSEGGDASRTAARRFLAENHGLFKMNASLDDLDDAGDAESPMGRHFVLQQKHRGVPVYGAEVKVHFNRRGEIVGVSNGYVTGIRLSSARPAFSAEAALALARSLAPPAPEFDASELAGLPAPSTKLVVYPVGDRAELAWEVVLATGGPTWQIFIDAQSGKPLSAADLNKYANGAGSVFRVNAVVATQNNSLRDQRDAASAVPVTAYMAVTLLGLAGNGFLDGLYASSSKTKRRVSNGSNSFLYDRSSDGFSEVMGYYYLDYAQRYIQSLGFSNVNNRRQVFSVNRYNQDNSFYSPGTKELTFGLGGVDDAEDADVIWHEYGHSMQDNQVPGFGSTLEAGSMGEGFSDYWAGTIGAQLSNGFQDTCIAEWDAVSYSSSNPPCLRRLDSAKHYPEAVVGEVHDDGEIWSAALWQIRGAIGAGQADKVIIEHHFLLAPGASFNQAANALVTAAANLGYTESEVSSIRSILRARGFTVTV